MKKNFLFIAKLLLIPAVIISTSCEKELPNETMVEPDAAVTKYIPANFNIYTITQPGTYIIKGTVTGKYIKMETGDVVIKGEGSNPTFKGKRYDNEKRFQSHIRGGGNGTLTIKDFTMIGKAGHNCIQVSSNNTLIENLKIYNDTKAGAGAINAGKNSMITRCHLQPHDDAIKISEPNSRAKDNDLKMDGNGAAILIGWGAQADGAIHYADDIRIRGYLRNNGQTNTCGNPGRSIIGGIMEHPISDIKLTKLDINMSSEHNGHYVKLNARGGDAKDIYISGVIHNNVSVKAGIKPVALAATNGGKMKNVTINFGNKIKNSDVFISSGVTNVTIGGGTTNDCDNDPAPTGSILVSNLNAVGNARIKVQANDNKGVTKVDLMKGTQKIETLTSPNAGAVYRFITSQLTSGDAYTVKIFDGCGNIKTLAGTIDGGSTDPCVNDPAPTGSIVKADYNARNHGRIIVSASDNQGHPTVEVFKGNTSMGKFTAPNYLDVYRIVNANLKKGNQFTVVITDSCGKTKILNGTMP